MDIYGDLDFKEVGHLVSSALAMESPQQFPDETAGFALNGILEGRLTFFNNRVWIAVEITNGIATWVPLTNEINAYVHAQAVASASWNITHNLQSGTPVVQVYDELNQQVIPDEVEPASQNAVTVTFNSAMTGRAIVLVGNLTGLNRADYPQVFAFEHTQSVEGDTWIVAHGLGYYPIVRVFTGGSPDEEIQPASVVHNSTMQVTITFSSPRTGRVRMI
jgi:hypothetical protein